MPRESELLTAMRLTNTRSIRRRMRYVPLLSLTALTVFVPLLGLIGNAAAADGDSQYLGWRLGIALWVLAALLVPVFWVFAVEIQRAIVVYTLLTTVLFPASFAILDGALRLSIIILGSGSTMVTGLGLLLGLATLPLVIRTRRNQFHEAISKGHLRRSLDKERASWDAQYDNDEALATEWLKRPGCLIRILPWIGPAIGMRLADVFGRSTANLIMVAGFIGIGYALTYFGLVKASVQLLEFRRMERELGRPIMLAEEPAPEKG